MADRKHCDYCDSYGSGLHFYGCGKINRICVSCVEELASILYSIGERIYLTNYEGVFVKEVSSRDINIPRSFDVGDIVIALGNGRRDRIKDDDSLLLFYDMCNFDSLKDDLEHSENWHGEVIRDCSSCGEDIEISKAHSLRDAKNKKSLQFYHYGCLNYIISEIEKFEEENKELVVSRVL